MTHGQTDDIPDINQPIIVVDGPEQISYLQAFEAQLLRTDTSSKYLHVSPALRGAGRDEWLEMLTKIERLELAVIWWQNDAKSWEKLYRDIQKQHG